MSSQSEFIQSIYQLISNDELEEAFQLLAELLEDSPHLNEIVHQSSRFNDLKKQTRLGLIDFTTASISKNKIRSSLLELLEVIEHKASSDKVAKEISAFEYRRSNEPAFIDTGASTVYGNINITAEVVAARDLHLGHLEKRNKKSFWMFWKQD